MAASPRGKKALKITGIILGVLLLLLFGFHLWFKAHARHLLEDLVAKRSNGKVNMKLQKLHFGYFSNKMELENAVFFNTDSSDSNTAYRFSVKRIKLEVKGIWPILFKNEFLIDSLSLTEPNILVTRHRAVKKDTNRGEVSIPAEMGKVYNSIRDALKVFKVSSFKINDGTFTLINRVESDNLPITISHINLFIDNFVVDTTNRFADKKILFSDNIVLNSHHQDILFPDGRHRLSFRNFNINLRDRIVRFDSCTIAATRSDSANASFHVFLDTLLLTNIDFDTLYRTELIKADSVYCVNPKFTLDVALGKRRGGPAPRLEDMVKQLTGDLELAHVVVSNAEFNIRTIRDSIPTSFVFTQNNFEMEGLHVDQEAERPVKVKKFVMAIRNYENFIQDSSYSILFDSILLNDDRITLSNFVFNKLNNGRITNSFRIPQFNLQGLSWDDLVFERRLRAEQAIMFNPVINYSMLDAKRKRQTIFEVLGSVNEYMDLQYLDVIDGKIDLQVNDSLRIQLDSATLAIQSHSLLTSKKLSSLKNSLTRLYFKRGRIRAGNLDMELGDIRYIGNSGQFEAGTISITDDEKKLDIHLNRAAVQNMRVDEMVSEIFAKGVTWQSGHVRMRAVAKHHSKPVTVHLQNVHGYETALEGLFGPELVSTRISKLAFSSFDIIPGNKPVIQGLSLEGNNLDLRSNVRQLHVQNYQLRDRQQTQFNHVRYRMLSSGMDADLRAPQVTLIPSIDALIQGSVSFDSAEFQKPVILIRQEQNTPITNDPSFPLTDIGSLKLLQPEIKYTQVRDSGTFTMEWHGASDPKAFLLLTGLHADSGNNLNLSIKSLGYHLSGFTTTGERGRKLSTGNGMIAAELKNVEFAMENNLPAEWQATISQLDAKDLVLDSIGKKNGRLQITTASLSELRISTTKIINLRRMIAGNALFRMRNLNGNYTDSEKELNWYNAGFTPGNNTFSLDSFSFRPVLSREDFMKEKGFQTDYVTARTGKITIGPVSADQYTENDRLQVGKISLDDVYITDYRDKNYPQKDSRPRPLPGKMIQLIPLKLSADTLSVNNANIEYTEVNPALQTTAIVPVTQLQVTAFPVKNVGLSDTDSLHIYASGSLLDTLHFQLRMKESYTDSLHGFHMITRMNSLDLQALNPVLEPTSMVHVKSGQMDSMLMRVWGNSRFAYGQMDFAYRSLKIQLVKKASDKKKKTGFLNFIVNSFFVRNKSRKTATVFYERDDQRSAINYLVRMLMSGITNAVGAKNHKKAMKPYEGEIRNIQLPGEF